MQQQDLQQISDLMDQKFKENNKTFKKEIVDEVGRITNDSFNEFDGKIKEKFTEVKQEFKKINDKCDNIYGGICGYTDNELKDLELDMDKVKFIHLKEWDKLPPTIEISKALAEKGLRQKQ